MNGTVSRAENTLFKVLDLEVDLARQTVRRDGEALLLPELSFRLLAALIRCAPETIGKDELVRAVWDEVVVSDETLSQRVRLLRQALGEDGQDPRYLGSVRGRGYRLLCPVDAVAMAPVEVESQSERRPTRLPAGGVVAALLFSLFWLWPLNEETGEPTPEVHSSGVLLPTISIDAYNAYLIGRYHTFAQTPEDLARAIAFLEQAVAIDPEFAEAWAMLGWAYSFVGTLYGERPPREVYPKAKAAVTRALSIDNQLANARTLYADILAWYDWDFAAAEREYLKTLALDPNNVLGYVLYLSTQLRHEEAIALIERRIAAYPEDAYVHINAAWTFMRNGQYERAILEASLAPEHPDADPVLGFAYLALGEHDKAVQVFESSLRSQGGRPRHMANLAIAYFEVGREGEAQQLLDEVIAVAASQYVPQDLIADVYFAAGDAEKGFAALQQAVEDRSRGVIFLQTNSSLDGYRQDPRYLALIEAVGF